MQISKGFHAPDIVHGFCAPRPDALAGEPDRSFATSEIAAEFEISRNHLAKVVRDLAEAGFIATQRGAGGGFSLARPAETITLGEVVRALEGGSALVECFRDDG